MDLYQYTSHNYQATPFDKESLAHEILCKDYGLCPHQGFSIHESAEEEEEFQVIDDLINDELSWKRDYSRDYEACDGIGNCKFDVGNFYLKLDQKGNV